MVALLAVSVLPLAHAHARESGGTLVHSHIVSEAGDRASALDHGDHHAARPLSPNYVQESKVDVALPAVAVATFLRPAVSATAVTRGWEDEALIHGPPIRLSSPRAPPALSHLL